MCWIILLSATGFGFHSGNAASDSTRASPGTARPHLYSLTCSRLPHMSHALTTGARAAFVCAPNHYLSLATRPGAPGRVALPLTTTQEIAHVQQHHQRHRLYSRFNQTSRTH